MRSSRLISAVPARSRNDASKRRVSPRASTGELGCRPADAHATGFRLTPRRIAVVTSTYWQGGGPPHGGLHGRGVEALRARILLHLNAWSKSANVKFVASQVDPDVRVGGSIRRRIRWLLVARRHRHPGVARDQPTMNLEGFRRMPESEYRAWCATRRAPLGFDHEHLRESWWRRSIPPRPSPMLLENGRMDLGETREQVPHAPREAVDPRTQIDPRSIMCYDIPARSRSTTPPSLAASISTSPTTRSRQSSIPRLPGRRRRPGPGRSLARSGDPKSRHAACAWLPRRAARPSVFAHRGERIETSRAIGGHQAGDDGGQREHSNRREQRQGIGRADLEHERAHQL